MTLKKAVYEMKRIESTQNTLVKHWKKLVTTRKERDKSGEFIVEGFHLVEEALKNKEQLLQIIVREDVDIPSNWNVDNVVIIQITDQIAKEIAETETSQGIFAHCKQQKISNEAINQYSKFLLVDGVQDPGNIGTIIRTADAAGIDAVILGKGTVDCYNQKTLRAAQGSHFHLPIIRKDLLPFIDELKVRNIPVFGTSLQNAKPLFEIESRNQFAVIVGNEGAGIQPEILEKTDENIIIPIYGKAESLNVAVATGILLYRLVGEI